VSGTAGRPLHRNRDFALLWTGQGTSALGSQLSQVAYPLLVLALGHSAADAGIVGFARNLPIFLLSLPAGALADRIERRRLMRVVSLVGAAGLTVIPLGLAAGWMPVWLIALVAWIDGSVFTLSYITERGLLRRLVPPAQLRAAITRNESRMFGSMMAGPPLGGVLFGIARGLPFIGDAVSYLVSVTTLSLIRGGGAGAGQGEGEGEGEGEQPAPASDLRAGLRWMWKRPLFRFTMVLFAASNPIFTGCYLLVVVLARQHGASSSLVGLMLAIAAAGGLAGALVAPRLQPRVTPRGVVVGESWLIALALPWLLVARNPLLLGLIIAAAELITPVTNSTLVSLRVELAPDALQGRVQAAATLVSFSGAWAGPLVVGVLLSGVGAHATVAVLAGWAIVLAVIATFARSLRHMPAADAPVPV
jgi:MFS family permease